MTKQTEAMKLALEWDEMRKYIMPYMVRDAIREALAERCVCGEPDTPGTHRTDGPCLAEQPAQQQEPVAWITKTGNVWKTKAYSTDIPLYTAPPAQRTWVGLTDEEMQALWYRFGYMELMRAIEAKLKEKNCD